MSRAAQKAVALAQQEKSTWTRADLIKYLGRVLPRSGLDPAAAAALLEDLADRALRSEFEPVLCLEAPEAVEVPRSLLRADGRSVYQRHGGVRYATRAQLAMEDRMLAQAPRRRRAAPDPRRRRASARRGPGAARARAGRARARRARRAHRDRAAWGPGRGGAVGTDRRQARLGDQRPGRIRQDAGPGRAGTGLGGGRARPGDRHHAVAVRPQHPGGRHPGVVQHRPVPRPPARPARRPRPSRDQPGHLAVGRRDVDDQRPGPGRPDQPRRGQATPR